MVRDWRLASAVEKGDLPQLREMLVQGADVNATGSGGAPLLLLASERGHIEIMKLLLERKANINATSRKGETPLMAAARNGRAAAVELLLSQGASVAPHAKDGTTALLSAASSPTRISPVVPPKAPAKAASTGKQTATEESGSDPVFGEHSIVRRLLDAGANINEQDEKGTTALMAAAAAGTEAVVDLLRCKGADPAMKDRSGRDAAAHAKGAGHTVIADALGSRFEDGLYLGTVDEDADNGILFWIKDNQLISTITARYSFQKEDGTYLGGLSVNLAASPSAAGPDEDEHTVEGSKDAHTGAFAIRLKNRHTWREMASSFAFGSVYWATRSRTTDIAIAGAAKPNATAVGLMDVAISDGSKVNHVRWTARRLNARTNPKDDQAYVFVPPGEFEMGCSAGDKECMKWELPRHKVKISRGFWLAQTEVLQRSWKKAMKTNPSHFEQDDLPVERVTWAESKRYCESIGGRLPTEAEWEYAARAGTTGGLYGDLGKIAWVKGNSSERTHPPGRKSANAWGLFDMIGNVWEWCSDWYEEPYSPSRDENPTGPPAGTKRVIRGGSWFDDSRGLWVSDRLGMAPDFRSVNFGVRCVIDETAGSR